MSKSLAADELPKYSFHFILKKYDGNSQEFQGRYHVHAEPLNESLPKYNHRVSGDLLFNLSGVLGNKDGTFDWGTSFFEKTVSGKPTIEVQHTLGGEPIPTGQPIDESKVTNVQCVLKAKLLDLSGKPTDAEIDLHRYLKLTRYQLGGVTYHRLTERRAYTGPLLRRTSNHFSDKNTNVVKLAELLKKDDPTTQMIYYQTGVGTYKPPGLPVVTSVGLAVSSALDQAVAWYLYQHVIDGYKFLMQTYRAGDKIALFGFSRGAFTARALAGMLHCVGLLPAHNFEHVAFAYQVYKNVPKGCEDPKVRQKKLAEKKNKLAEWLDPEDVEPEDFKKAFSVPVVIDFVGVWDTVASVGAVWMREFRWIEYNPSILVFRQALALDEHRGNFIPSLWDHGSTDAKIQDAREVWFRGEHCDVGGGSAGPVDKSADDVKMFSIAGVCRMVRQVLPYGTNARREPMPGSTSPEEGRTNKQEPDFDYTMLSNISLRWMVRQMLQFNTGILLDPVAVREYQVKGILETPLANGLAPDLGELGPPKPRNSDELDSQDIKKKTYDSIGWSPLWNVLEYFGFTQKPIKYKDEKDKKYKLTTTRCPNAKAGRSIYYSSPDHPVFIHRSAAKMAVDPLEPSGGSMSKWICRLRLEWLFPRHVEQPYKPRARWYGYGNGQLRIEDLTQSNGITTTLSHPQSLGNACCE